MTASAGVETGTEPGVEPEAVVPGLSRAPIDPRLLTLSRPARRWIVLAAVLAAARTLSIVAFGLAIGWIGASTLDPGAATPSAGRILAVLAVPGFAQIAIAWAERRSAHLAAAGIIADLRTQAAAELALMDVRTRTADSARWRTALTEGLDGIGPYLGSFLPVLASTFIAIPSILLVIGWLDLTSAITAAVTLPLIPIFMILIGKLTEGRTSARLRGLAVLSEQMLDLVAGLPTLRAFRRTHTPVAELGRLGESHRSSTMRVLRIAFLSSLALELIATISVALVAVVIGLRLVNGTMDLGDGLLVLLIAPECFIPLRELGAGYHASENGREARERARSLVSETQAAEPALDISGRPGEQRVLYTDGTIITWSGTIDAGPGVTTISGRSGTGKTTVLGALVGSLPADAHTTADPLTAAYVPQAPRMFAETIGAELNLFGLDDDRARTALSAAGLPTDLRVQTAALSPGQQRRLALVRVQHRLGDGADVLVLDEPTAHLDEDNADIVINLIAEAAATHRVILASHDERVRALADTEIRPEKTRISAAERAKAMASTVTAAAAATATTTANAMATADRGRTGNAEAPAVNSWDESSSADERTSSGDETVTLPMAEDRSDVEKQRTHGESGTATLRRRWSILNSSLPLFTPTMLLAALTACASSLAAIALTAVSAWLIVEASYQPPIMLLMVAIVGVRFFGLSRSVLLYASRLKLHSAIFAALTRLRTRLWEHFERVGMSDRRLLTSDSALRAMVADADDVRDLVPRTLFPPFVSALVVIGVSITAALLDVSALGWFILLGAVNLVIVPTLVIQAESRLALGIREDRNRILSVLTRALHAKDDLRTNRVESRVLGLLAGLESDLEAKQKASARNVGLAQLWLQLSTFTTAVILAASSGAPTEIVAVLSLMALGLGEVFASALEAFRQLPGLGTALDCLPDPDGAVDSDAEASALSAPTDELVGVDALEFEKITVGWDDNTVVSGLDLEAERGGWTVLCGDSGTGKTTSLSVLLRFLDPWSGSYRARDRNGTDHDMLTRSPEVLVGRIAWCPQEAHVFRSTVRGNLALAQRSVPGDDEMFSALRAAGLSDWADAGGLDRWVGDHGTEISGGQRQRLAVARTLLTGADVIVLDEPTAHLDDETARALIDDLRGSPRDRTVVMVTHDRRLITDGDEVVDLGTRVPEAEASRV